MPGPVFRHGDRLSLRTVEPEDYEFLQRHWNDPEIRHATAHHDPMDGSDVAAFVEDASDEVHFLPCRDGEPVGFAWLFRIDDVAGRGELGYWIVADERGWGYATEAARLCLGYAFDERGLRKVSARVFEGNDASKRVLEKLGFQQEGRLREHYYVDGERVDADLYALLAEEW